ncbi:MAG: hypothetical protein SCH70_05600 [Candidatus Methanoperedens sp.]|nr:hypothetical protein [Candidatus Methanoperedens sp.]
MKISSRDDKIPAIDLYNGPFYQTIKKTFRQNGLPDNLDILILSAKYGLIPSNELISTYDQMMTSERAKELQNQVMVQFKELFKDKSYNEIFVNLGKTYTFALEESRNLLDDYNVSWGYGQIGERLHQLKTWLNVFNSKESVFS